MKISLISTSHREKSESTRVSKILESFILKINNRINCYSLDMYESKYHYGHLTRKKISSFGKKILKKFQMN